MSTSKFADQTVALVLIPPHELPLFEMVMETLDAIVVPADPAEHPAFVVTGNISHDQYEELLEAWPDSQIVVRREIDRHLLDDLTIDELLEAARLSMPH